MSQDTENDFRVQMGRRKASSERRVRPKRPQSFLDSLTPRRGGRSNSYRNRPSRTVQRHFHRRVIVQASIKRMAGTGAAKLKGHLSYLERDATQKDASPGKLYGSLIHDVDADSFRDRCKGDRHHFRFVVSPEDAEQMADLKAYTRELVSRMESDLGTLRLAVGLIFRCGTSWSRMICCLLYTSPSPRDRQKSRMPSSA